jgi:hypothetical protein
MKQSTIALSMITRRSRHATAEEDGGEVRAEGVAKRADLLLEHFRSPATRRSRSSRPPDAEGRRPSKRIAADARNWSRVVASATPRVACASATRRTSTRPRAAPPSSDCEWMSDASVPLHRVVPADVACGPSSSNARGGASRAYIVIWEPRSPSARGSVPRTVRPAVEDPGRDTRSQGNPCAPPARDGVSA